MSIEEQPPERIDFAPGVYGLNYETQGRYLGEVYSQVSGNGPTCLYDEGEKIYILRSGDVEGKFVEGEYVVYELDLRDLGKPVSELKDSNILTAVIDSRKEQIRLVQLEIGKEHRILPGVLHQACGKGILRIEVPSGYIPEKVIETDEIDLSSKIETKK